MVYGSDGATAERASALFAACSLGIQLLNVGKAKDLRDWLWRLFFEPRSGMVIDGYRLVRKIGEGSFGAAWYAVNKKTDRAVMLMIIKGSERIRQEHGALKKFSQICGSSEYLLRVEHVSGGK
jgi:hypothetical protein